MDNSNLFDNSNDILIVDDEAINLTLLSEILLKARV